ncbi:MAG: histidinol-phosphate transaminase, partial [Elusimicrobiota bacterium]
MIEKLVRKEIAKVQPYIPGKPIETLKRELKIRGEIIKLASNENSLGPSPKAVVAIKKAARDVFRYPEGSSFLLREAVAKRFSVSPREVIFGSGTDELIEQLGKTFLNPEDEIVVSEHAFVRYQAAGDLMGAKVVSVPMIDYRHDLTMMAEAATLKTKMVFIANPNNPTGTYNDTMELSGFLKRLMDKFGRETAKSVSTLPIIVIDEAYYEYALSSQGYPKSINFYSGKDGCLKYPNLVILRTFSKVYGLAGLRVGYGIANEKIIQFLDRVRPPFNVSCVAQAAALAALKDEMHIKKSIRTVEEGKKFLYWELRKMGLKFIPSAANFIMIDVSPFKGQTIFEMLLRRGVIVRSVDEYNLPSCIRVTVGTQRE